MKLKEIKLSCVNYNLYESSDNYTKGCKWSPDGTCLLVSSQDNHLRTFELPFANIVKNINVNISPIQLNPVFNSIEAETIYDFAWYSEMNSSNPTSCFYASTSKAHPIHTYDAFTGKLLESYRFYDKYDELTAAFSLCFTEKYIYCGLNSEIRIVTIEDPGRTDAGCLTDQSGILSTITICNDMLAVGSYNGSICIYDTNLKPSISLPNSSTGVTNLKFSYCGNYLYSGCRKSGKISCFDIRTCALLNEYTRKCDSNQRIYFDISNDYLVTGSTDNELICHNVTLEEEPQTISTDDVVNCVSLHPFYPLIATTTGKRNYSIDSDSEGLNNVKNGVQIWSLKNEIAWNSYKDYYVAASTNSLII